MSRLSKVAHLHLVDNRQARAKVEATITACVKHDHVRHLRTIEWRETEIRCRFTAIPKSPVNEMKRVVDWPLVVYKR